MSRTELTEWTWSRFEATPPMATYLVAWAVTEFEAVERTIRMAEAGRKLAVRFWTRPGDGHRVAAALDISERVLDTLEGYLNATYPLPKMDFMVLPASDMDFPSIENWGLVFVG